MVSQSTADANLNRSSIATDTVATGSSSKHDPRQKHRTNDCVGYHGILAGRAVDHSHPSPPFGRIYDLDHLPGPSCRWL